MSSDSARNFAVGDVVKDNHNDEKSKHFGSLFTGGVQNFPKNFKKSP
jgi:hypothetical protein